MHPPTTSNDFPSINYYKATLSGVTYPELWRMMSPVMFLIAATMKVFGGNMPLAQGLQANLHLEYMRATPDQIAPEVLNALLEMVEECVALGFKEPILYHQPQSLLPGVESAAMACIHSSGEVFADMMAVQSTMGLKKVASFTSAYSDGTFYDSGNAKMEMTPDPKRKTLHMPGKTASQTFSAHEAGRTQWGRDRQIRRVSNFQELDAVLYDYEASGFEWNIGRGFYCLMTKSEIEVVRRQHLSSLDDPNFPIAEISCSLMAAGEHEGLTCDFSFWSLGFSNAHGDMFLGLDLDLPIGAMIQGREYTGMFKRNKKSKYAHLRERFSRLLAQPTLTFPETKDLPFTVEFIGRSNPADVNLSAIQKAGVHAFQLHLKNVDGAFLLLLHPALYELRLIPQLALDRATACAAFHALLHD